MIACRYLCRVDFAWRVTNSCVISPSLRKLQRCSSYRLLNHNLTIDIGGGLRGRMDRQKQKTVSHERRKVPTQSSAQQEEQHIASAEKHSISVDATSSTQKHSIAVEVGASLIGFIKGRRGATQKKIEDETGVKITFPSSRKEDSIVIEGDSIENVTRASKRIQIIIDEVINSPRLDYSHFVSLPLAVHPELVDKLVKFQNSILGICDHSGADSSGKKHRVQHLGRTTELAAKLKSENDSKHVNADISSIPLVSYPATTSNASASKLKNTKLSELGIERSIFIKPKTFHLTVLMLKLWNKQRIEAAAEVLRSISSKVMQELDNRPVSIRLKGLACMRGSFEKARVLYAPVEEIGDEGRLFRACQVIINAFVEAGLVPERDAQRKLKLHATVMNARHRERNSRIKNADCFDARSIVDRFGSEDWGEYLIREAHLSQSKMNYKKATHLQGSQGARGY